MAHFGGLSSSFDKIKGVVSEHDFVGKIKNFLTNEVSKLGIMVSGALTAHMLKFCVVGVCDDVIDNFEPNPGSMCFVVAIALLLTKSNIYPTGWKPLPPAVVPLYNLLISLFVTASLVRLVWIPFMGQVMPLAVLLSDYLTYLNRVKGLGKQGYLRKMAKAMESKMAIDIISTAAGLVCLTIALACIDAAAFLKERILAMAGPELLAEIQAEQQPKPEPETKKGSKKDRKPKKPARKS